MDLWDVAKVMWRRWYVTAPLLLLVLSLAIWVATSVGPAYRATGHVTVVPPEVQRSVAAGQASRINPWNEEALAHAASIRLEANQLEDELAEEGYRGDWGVTVTGRLPVLTIEVVSPTADQAVRTMHRLQQVVEDEVVERQSPYNIGDGERFSTVRYDAGESVETTRSKLIRALVAVLGAGLLLTTGVVLAVDAIMRWRRNRTGRSAAGSGTEQAEGAGPVAGGEPRYTYGRSVPATDLIVAGPGAVGSGQGQAMAGSNGAGHGAGHGAEKLSVPFRIAEAPSRPVSPAAPDEYPDGLPEDATIVLPLSGGVPWAGRPRSSRPNRGDGDAGDSTGAEKP